MKTVYEVFVVLGMFWLFQMCVVDRCQASSSKAKAPIPELVVIDQSMEAYTVLMALPKDLSVAQLDKVKAQIAGQKGVELVAWEQFQKGTDKYITNRIVKNEYPDIELVTGIVEVLIMYPGTPIGVTWNGGITITATDYRYAEKAYQKYQVNPEEYERTRNKDPKSDPLNPNYHFDALFGQEKSG
jgi:hypothetical protein